MLVRLLVRNRDLLDGMEGGLARLGGLALKAWHGLRRNTRRGSRRNIAPPGTPPAPAADVPPDAPADGAGGPEHYAGKDMLATHRGMNISEQEYLAVVDDIMGVLERHRIDGGTRKDVLAILYSLKGEIIRT